MENKKKTMANLEKFKKIFLLLDSVNETLVWLCNYKPTD